MPSFTPAMNWQVWVRTNNAYRQFEVVVNACSPSAQRNQARNLQTPTQT